MTRVTRKATRSAAPRKAARRVAAVRKAAPRKTTARKLAAAKAAARRTAAVKAAPRKAARKAASAKTTARRPAAAKTTARKPAAKSSARKAVARKPAARKAAARKTAARKPALKVAASKSARRTTVARKAAVRRPARRAAAARKPAGRKSGGKKSSRHRGGPASGEAARGPARKAERVTTTSAARRASRAVDAAPARSARSPRTQPLEAVRDGAFKSSVARGVPVHVGVVRLDHADGLPLPAYQTAGAAGLDLLAALPPRTTVTLRPRARVLVPTGLVLELPVGIEAQVRPRSGLAMRDGVTVLNSPGTIDSDYRGEVQVLLVNLGNRPISIGRGDRIAQLVVAPVSRAALIEIMTASATARGAGGFGSTGRGDRVMPVHRRGRQKSKMVPSRRSSPKRRRARARGG